MPDAPALTAAIAGGAVGAVLFVELFLRLGTLARARRLMMRYGRIWRVVRSSRISDHWKERVMLRYAGGVLADAAVVVLCIAIALAGLLAVAALGGLAIAGSPAAAGALLAGWPFNLAALAVGVAYAAWRGRR